MAKNNSINNDGFDNQSSFFAKMFIIIVFCIAITFAILAFVLRFQNEKREARLYNPAWKIEIQENATAIKPVVELPENAAEFVSTARQLSTPVKNWRTRMLEGNLVDDRRERAQMENYIADILRELGITIGYTITKEFPRNFTARDLPRTMINNFRKAGIQEEGVKLRINEITREKLIQLIQTVEDKYPFATAQTLMMTRDREDDTGKIDNWRAEISFVWFFRDTARTSS